jgi:hypothetical protein
VALPPAMFGPGAVNVALLISEFEDVPLIVNITGSPSIICEGDIERVCITGFIGTTGVVVATAGGVVEADVTEAGIVKAAVGVFTSMVLPKNDAATTITMNMSALANKVAGEIKGFRILIVYTPALNNPSFSSILEKLACYLHNLRDRLKVGRRSLKAKILVRFQVPQQQSIRYRQIETGRK